MNFDFDRSWDDIRNGDIKVFESLYKRLYSALCYYSKQITRDRQLSEEIVQDVFYKFWMERDYINIKTSLKAYLFQSVRNQSINELRKNQNLRNAVNRTADDEFWKYAIDNYESNEFIIERLISEDLSKNIEIAVKMLSPQSRQVFHMSRTENLSNEEIAKSLGISVNTVRSHLYNALCKISDILHRK
jgi:RNA polymerase sigma-70 factor (ECF subfamily)